MSIPDNKAVLEQFNQVMGQFWQTGDTSVFDAVIAADAVIHQPGFPPNREGFKQALPAFRTAFPDFRVLEFETFGEGDQVADRVVWTATHTGELMGIPPTGKTITVRETHIRRFAGGKIVEHWGQWDQIGMMQQIGVIPSE
jgi:predicted ester cyclase